MSEMTLLMEDAPGGVREYLDYVYPAIKTIERNLAEADSAGLRAVDTYTLPRESWVEDYYDVLGPRAEKLIDHPDSSVHEMAAETIREIEVFKSSGHSYGYVFYVFERVV